MRRLLGLGAAATLTACSGPLVGGECLDGYRQVEGKCVASDVPGGSGGSGDDGHAGSGSSSGTGLGSGSGSDSGSGGLDGGGSDATSAGGDPNPSECADGDLACGGVCVDVRTDPYHCGACGNVCASGICVDGHCEGDFAGHVVLCGIEAERSTGVAPTRLIGNAVFAWPVDPVRIGVLRVGGAESATLDQTLAAEASRRGRSIALEDVADVGTMAARLAGAAHDVVLLAAIPDQAADATSAGTQLAAGIAALTARGGVVVFFAPRRPQVVGPFLDASGLASDVTATPADEAPLDVVAFDDALAAGLPSLFARPDGTLAFEAPQGSGRLVVADAAERAVVVHDIVEP